MASDPSPQLQDTPPFGSWARTYLAVAAAAVMVMAILWWLTAHFNTPLGSAK